MVQHLELRTRDSGLIYAQVDDEDYPLVSQYTWCRSKQKHTTYVYRQVRVEGKRQTIYLHRFLTGWARVDHIDRNGLNNCRSNLREATAAQNSMNKSPNARGASRFKGVSRQGVYWKAQLMKDGQVVFFKKFKDELEAAKAYDTAAKAHFGPFAYLNFDGSTSDAFIGT